MSKLVLLCVIALAIVGVVAGSAASLKAQWESAIVNSLSEAERAALADSISQDIEFVEEVAQVQHHNPAPVFTIANSAKMFQAASAAYCDQKFIADWSCSYCAAVPGLQVDTVAYSAATDMTAYVGHHPGNDNFFGAPVIIVAFKGTNPKDFRDIVSDVNFPKVNLPYCDGCQAHQGFVNAFASVQDAVITSLKEVVAANPSAAVFVIGHSLGGATATVAAAYIDANVKKLPYLWTFGSPRVFNVAMSNYLSTRLNGQSLRVTNDHDIVPHVPFRLLGFQHVAQEFWFNKATNSYLFCNGNEDPNCADSLKPALSVDDHLHYMGVDFPGLGSKPNCEDPANPGPTFFQSVGLFVQNN